MRKKVKKQNLIFMKKKWCREIVLKMVEENEKTRKKKKLEDQRRWLCFDLQWRQVTKDRKEEQQWKLHTKWISLIECSFITISVNSSFERQPHPDTRTMIIPLRPLFPWLSYLSECLLNREALFAWTNIGCYSTGFYKGRLIVSQFN